MYDVLSGGMALKIVVTVLMMSLLLCGCGVQETYETIADEMVQPVMAQPKQIQVDLPGDVLAPVLKTAGEQVYLARDHEIIVETRSSGDLNATVAALSGFSAEELTLMQRQQDGCQRYDFVWTSAGEAGDRMGRAVILDDGDYHYCMTVLRDAAGEEMSQTSWEDVFSSFHIAGGTPDTAA